MSTVVKGAKRALIWLGVIIVVLYSILTLGVVTGKTTLTPGLGLDLAGGTTLILKASTTDQSAISADDLNQAVEVIRRRIDASGVNEPEITTQGTNTIVIALPGHPSNHTIDLIKQSAQLQFRPVLQELAAGVVTDTSATPTPSPSASTSTSPSASPSPSATAGGAVVTNPSATPSATPSASATPTATASASPSASPSPNPSPVPGVTSPSSYDWLTDSLLVTTNALDCTKAKNVSGVDLGDPNAGHVACSTDLTRPQKFVMGPVELTGNDVKTATSGPYYGANGQITSEYQVNLEFNSAGAQKFSDVTARLYAFYKVNKDDPRAKFAILLDGGVISAPAVQAHITGGTATITGNFTQQSAQELANQLKFGAIPLTLTVQSLDTVSPTLGTNQLEKGLIAGAIGLLLVVIYTLFQYRALAAVTIGSLVIAGVITFGMISLLSWGIGFRLSLAGVAGLIIAIGITADSFIVYFERVKDELREGRSLQASIDHAWKRARRTILASDGVSFLAAVVLYMLAIGSVRGFAFTLGLTTLVDVLVVILFTHPVLILLSRTKFFGEGHRFSGLDPRQLGKGAIYKGRGRAVGAPVAEAGEAQGLTLAERKAAAAKGDVK